MLSISFRNSASNHVMSAQRVTFRAFRWIGALFVLIVAIHTTNGLLNQRMHTQERRYARTTLQTGDKSRTLLPAQLPHNETFHEVDDSQPVTFLSSQSFLSLPKWNAYQNGSISLKFRTNEGNGVLIFSHGIKNAADNDGSDSNYDYFGIELLGGHVFLLMNMGSGAMKVKSSNRRTDDGNWHLIQVTREGRAGRVSVDENSVSFITPGSSAELDLEGSLFVGAVGTSGFLIAPSATKWTPPELWSGSLGYGFVGCLDQLTLNGVLQELPFYAQEQDSGGVRIGCNHSSRSHCSPSSCLNQGTCVEGWNRRVCSCFSTGYSGPNCAKESLILSFSGDQYFKLALPHTSVTQAEDLYIRFRSVKSSGLILAGVTETLLNYLVICLESSRLKVVLNLGEGHRVSEIGYNLNDDLWHSLKIERRGPWLEIKLDGVQHVAEITGMLITLQMDSIYVGSLGSKKLHDLRSAETTESTFFHLVKDIPNFTGLIQSLILNGNDFIELSRSGQIYGIFNSTAEFDLTAEREQIEYNIVGAVTFKSKWTFVALNQMSAYSRMNIYFQFKTLSANGLVLFNAGKGSHFVAVELENGHIVYSFNLGDGAKRLASRSKNLNDNNWHSVTIIRSIFNHHSLRVDDQAVSLTSPGVNTHLILRGLLYFGGLPQEMYFDLPKAVKSSYGYEGCFANIDMNHELVDPTSAEQAVIPSTLVAPGCSYAAFSSSSSFLQEIRCPLNTCDRRGVCVQYTTNQFACDCDQSSFTGSSCSEEGVSFRFGRAPLSSGTRNDKSPAGSSSSPPSPEDPPGGIVTVNFPDGHQVDTKSDTLTLGIITRQENSVILRVDSATTSDYMELQVVGGKILMAYNLGSEDHVVTDPQVGVSDNKYHVLRFTRSGPNSTLQIDHHNPVSRDPSGRKQMTIFDTLAKIQIGGRLGSKTLPSPAPEVPKPFQGIISGLTFNGMMILDLAAEKDERITISGEVSLVAELPKKFNPSNVESLLRNETRDRPQPSHHSRLSDHQDELILSKDHLQFCWADDQCSSIGSSAPDDLITPFLTDSLSSPSITSGPINPAKAVCDRDEEEEDCGEGSGDANAEDDDEDREAVAATAKVDPDVISNERSTTTHKLTETFEFRPPTTSSSWTTSTTEAATTRRLPKTTPYIDPKDLEQSYRPRSTSSYPSYPKSRPEINEVPKPAVKKPAFYGPASDNRAPAGKDKGSQHHVSKTSTFSSVDRTALTIGIIATIIIVIVFVAPILLFTRLRMMDPSALSSPHINSQMIYSRSDLGANLQGSKSMGQFVPQPAALIATDGSVFNQSQAAVSHHQQLYSQLRHQHSENISSVPTSILKKKKDSSHEWYV